MRYRLALALRDIQRLCHFSPGSEAHKRNSLGNDGTIKENGNTNPASIMEKGGKLHLLWWRYFLDLIVSICCLFSSKSGLCARPICSCTVTCGCPLLGAVSYAAHLISFNLKLTALCFFVFTHFIDCTLRVSLSRFEL